jgi:hypothetical protein
MELLELPALKEYKEFLVQPVQLVHLEQMDWMEQLEPPALKEYKEFLV